MTDLFSDSVGDGKTLDLDVDQLLVTPIPSAIASRIRVAVIDGPDNGLGAVIPDRPLLVGSDTACDLVLTDPAVSRQHATLEQRPDGIFVRDRGSRNGTFVGGKRVAEALATVGSVLRVGRSTLALLVEGKPQYVDAAPPELGSMVGTGPAMHRLFNMVGRLAASDATVLVRGETGVGKELVARTLHEQSRRASGPFVVFDCSAVPETLIAGELFGHVRGAFTGAHRDHVGAFERAHGGTLFIDEIGELGVDLQPKLLRALETRTVRRIGDKEEQQVDVRIVAATHRDIRHMVAERRFREDLLYRLAVVTVTVPPLRERLEDLEPIVQRFAAQLDPPPPPLPSDVAAALRKHHWPGNLRELRNLVERAAALGSWREEAHVPSVAEQAPAHPPLDPSGITVTAAAPSALTMGFREAKDAAMAAFEKSYLAELLATHGGNLSRAARAAGMDRSHLSTLVKKHALRG